MTEILVIIPVPPMNLFITVWFFGPDKQLITETAVVISS